jgi:biopolymer transport protein ExbD
MADERSDEGQELNMTSMIDVVFLLLVFFMLNLNFPVKEKTIQAVVPRAMARGAPTQRSTDPSIVFRVSRSGVGVRIQIEGVDLGADFNRAAERLKVMVADIGNPDIPVVISVDDTLPYQIFIDALDATRRAGVTNIQFSA